MKKLLEDTQSILNRTANGFSISADDVVLPSRIVDAELGDPFQQGLRKIFPLQHLYGLMILWNDTA